MLRVFYLSLMLLCLGAAPPPKTHAAPLSLTDEAAGYTMTLPEGWERMPEGAAREKIPQALALLPVLRDPASSIAVQGARLPGTAGYGAQETLVLAIPNAAFGIDDAALGELARKGNLILRDLREGMENHLRLSGLEAGATSLSDGLCLAYTKNVSGRRVSGGNMEIRFSTSHMIVALLAFSAEEEAQMPLFAAPWRLSVKPNKRIDRTGPRRFMTPLSSLFAIAGIALATVVLRRRRLQVLGKR